MKLGVNIDHIATLRNARGQNNPNLLRALEVCHDAKVDTLTVHLREDLSQQSLYYVLNGLTLQCWEATAAPFLLPRF